MKSDAERERLIQCLEAAIERRVSEVTYLYSKLKIDWFAPFSCEF